MQAALVGLGLAWAPGAGGLHPGGARRRRPTGLGDRARRACSRSLPSDPALPKVAHNAKYDLTVLRRHGLEVDGPIDDTLLMAWLLDPASRSLGLKALAADLLGWQMTELTELIGSGRKQITIDQVPVEPAAAYCGADVDATIQLYQMLLPRLHEAGL